MRNLMGLVSACGRPFADVKIGGYWKSYGQSQVEQLPALDRIIRGLVCLYCFSLPFKPLLFVERNGLIILISLVVLWCVLRKRCLTVPFQVALPVIAFAGWIGLAILWAAFPGYSLGELGKFVRDIFVLSTVIVFFRDPSDLKRLLQSMVASLMVVSVLGIGEFILSPP